MGADEYSVEHFAKPHGNTHTAAEGESFLSGFKPEQLGYVCILCHKLFTFNVESPIAIFESSWDSEIKEILHPVDKEHCVLTLAVVPHRILNQCCLIQYQRVIGNSKHLTTTDTHYIY